MMSPLPPMRLADPRPRLENSRKRPSFDQLVGWPSGSPSGRSSPEPSAGLMNSLNCRLRFEEKATLSPSGDHTGEVSSAGSNVKRVLAFRAMSRIQISRDPTGPTATATRVPSGDTAGLEYSLGSPNVPVGFPFSLNHVSASLVAAVERKTSVPVSDTENNP